MEENDTGQSRLTKIGIVGPCTAGKSTLIQRLDGRFSAQLRHIAQEHSYVQTMWQRISHPDWLIFLDVSYAVSLQRREDFNWTPAEYEEQQRRLDHAREHADLYILTDPFSAEQVAQKVIEFLTRVGVPKK